jgi:hypothetical protein
MDHRKADLMHHRGGNLVSISVMIPRLPLASIAAASCLLDLQLPHMLPPLRGRILPDPPTPA